MKFKKIILVMLLLLAVLTISSVSASEDIISDNNLTVSDEEVGVEETSLDDVELSEDFDSEILSAGPSKDEFYIDYKETVKLYSKNPGVICLNNEHEGYIISYWDNSSSDFSAFPIDYDHPFYFPSFETPGTYNIIINCSEGFVFGENSTNLVNCNITVVMPTDDDFSVYGDLNTVSLYNTYDYVFMVGTDWGEYFTGNLTVSVDENNPVVFSITDEDYYYDEPFWERSITIEDLNITSFGEYNVNFKFIFESGYTVDLGNCTTFVEDEPTFTRDDFQIYGVEKLIAVNSDDSVVYVYNNDACGNLTASINGIPVYNEKMNEKMNGIGNKIGNEIMVSDLQINSLGTYHIVVGYTHPTGKYSLTLLEDTFNVTEEEGYNGLSVFINGIARYGPLPEGLDSDWDEEPETLAGYEMNDVDLDGNILLFIDNELCYNKTMTFDGVIHLYDLNKKPSMGNHVVQIKYEENGVITTAKTRFVTVGSTVSKYGGEDNKNENSNGEKNNPVTPTIPTKPTTTNPTQTTTPTTSKKTETVKLTVPTPTVKKSAKKLVLKVTLKVNGKTVKNKVVKFKFNGKTYKVKTDKKGVAKLTIKKNILKKLKVGKKVKYQVSYGKTTIKKSVKVKK